jgi:hypothetical protein
MRVATIEAIVATTNIVLLTLGAETNHCNVVGWNLYVGMVLHSQFLFFIFVKHNLFMS